MTTDRSPYYYGWIYHKLFDSGLSQAREITMDLIPERASVLDIACGTGRLCFLLREKKNCRVTGVDLSSRMLRFAEKSNPYDNVKFIHADATNLTDFNDASFDFVTMLVLMHELDEEKQNRVLREALRVASKIIIMDSHAPLPRNITGIGIRLVEATFGHDHTSHFKNFLKNGGIPNILQRSPFPLTEEEQLIFGKGCRELIKVSKT